MRTADHDLPERAEGAPDDGERRPDAAGASVLEASGLLEERLADAGFVRVAGADEVGRGALAGPLVAAAVILPPGAEIDGLRDSKLCTRLQREHLARQIRAIAIAVSVVRITPARIDRVGLQRCNLQALRRALGGLDTTPDYVLTDGFPLRRLRPPSLGVKKADAVSRNVAAASIVAKVARDATMRRYHRRFPEYGFVTNVGYGTREHWAALRVHGPSEIHRRSFYGVCGFPEERPDYQGEDIDTDGGDPEGAIGTAPRGARIVVAGARTAVTKESR